jgi:hypothetical protein
MSASVVLCGVVAVLTVSSVVLLIVEDSGSKNEISKCKSKMPTLDISTVQFCPEESEIQTLFGIKPCSLKFSDDQHDIVIDAHRSQTEYKIEDFLSYNQEDPCFDLIFRLQIYRI